MSNIDELNILEVGLPPYLQRDIDAFIKGESDPNCTHLDCLYCEVLGSLNSAYWDKQITEEQFNYLWNKYS